MSYDINFIPKLPNQSWDQATEAHEQKCVSDSWCEQVPSDAERAAWKRAMARLQEVHSSLERFGSSRTPQLTDEKSGLQVSFDREEVAITIPYWHSDEEAAHVMGLAQKFALIIEEETNLVGFDPQLDRRFLDCEDSVDEGASVMADMSHKIHHEGLLTGGAKPRRAWWQFWKR